MAAEAAGPGAPAEPLPPSGLILLAAFGTIAIPTVGVFARAAILAEPVDAQEVVALALVCAALAIVLVLPVRRAGHRERSPAPPLAR